MKIVSVARFALAIVTPRQVVLELVPVSMHTIFGVKVISEVKLLLLGVCKLKRMHKLKMCVCLCVSV